MKKSGTDKLVIAILFGLSGNGIRAYLRAILEEEIDDCEFPLDSFFIAEVNDKLAATVAGWVEGVNSSDLPSSILKSNLLGYVLPLDCIEKSKDLSDVVAGIQLNRLSGSYQIEYVYCKPEFRNKGLASSLIQQHIANSNVKRVEVQVFGDNVKAVTLYKGMGFKIEKEVVSEHKLIGELFPSNKKILMTKSN